MKSQRNKHIILYGNQNCLNSKSIAPGAEPCTWVGWAPHPQKPPKIEIFLYIYIYTYIYKLVTNTLHRKVLQKINIILGQITIYPPEVLFKVKVAEIYVVTWCNERWSTKSQTFHSYIILVANPTMWCTRMFLEKLNFILSN